MPQGSSTNEKQARTYYKLSGLIGQGVFQFDDQGNVVRYFGDKTPYITQVQVNSGDANITYVGTADPGTATSAALWRILRLDETTGLITLRAGGNSNFVHIFDNRESLNYS